MHARVHIILFLPRSLLNGEAPPPFLRMSMMMDFADGNCLTKSTPLRIGGLVKSRHTYIGNLSFVNPLIDMIASPRISCSYEWSTTIARQMFSAQKERGIPAILVCNSAHHRATKL